MDGNEGDDPRVPVVPLDPQPPQPPIGHHPLVDATPAGVAAAPAGVAAAPAGVVGGPPLAGVVGGPHLAGVAGGVVVPDTVDVVGTPTGVIFVIFIRGFGSAKIPPTSSIVLANWSAVIFLLS